MDKTFGLSHAKRKDSANRAESKTNNEVFVFFPEVQPIFAEGKDNQYFPIMDGFIPKKRQKGDIKEN